MLDDGAEQVFRSTRFGERKPALVKGAFCVLFLLSISLAWRLTPLKESVDLETISSWQQSVKDHPAALFYVVAILPAGLKQRSRLARKPREPVKCVF
jgi:hypothetical protein